MVKSGFFITLEGGEGAGKTTQINRLSKALSENGYNVVTTREPGGTPESEKIRALMVQRDGGAWTPAAETLLMFAARVMHVEKRIKPALSKGSVVICDRFTDSTIAYQGYGHGFDLERVKDIKKASIADFEPDLTFVLDIDVTEGLSRSNKRLADEKGYAQTEDRFERMDIIFHENLRRGFLDIAKENPRRCCVVDAGQSVAHLAQQIQDHTLKCLKEREA
ncbi:MAG: dTMP kinase [Alphaproteobacteria bacterium]